MMDNSEVWRNVKLGEELRNSIRLIELGLGELQNLGGANDFYHLPLQLLASGIERLMKCHVCYGYLAKNNSFPSFLTLKNAAGRTGHGLMELKNEILSNYFETTVPLLREDYTFLTSGERLDKLLDILSEFGKYARYHNLDVVTENQSPSRDVELEWKQLEIEIAFEHPDIAEKLMQDIELNKEACKFIDMQIIITLEKFIGALCRQFTMGNLGVAARRDSFPMTYFILLKESDLGKRNYRAETTRFKNVERRRKKRNLIDYIKRKYNRNYVSKRINRLEFEGDWPFYCDNIIIECRYKRCCIVTIEGYDYALNGTAKSRYRLEEVTDAGMAVLGKSTSSFIQMALNLSNDNHRNT